MTVYKANANGVTHKDLILGGQKHKAVYAGNKLIWQKGSEKPPMRELFRVGVTWTGYKDGKSFVGDYGYSFRNQNEDGTEYFKELIGAGYCMQYEVTTNTMGQKRYSTYVYVAFKAKYSARNPLPKTILRTYTETFSDVKNTVVNQWVYAESESWGTQEPDVYAYLGFNNDGTLQRFSLGTAQAIDYPQSFWPNGPLYSFKTPEELLAWVKAL